ncbi:type III PLP-dependent enzyme [Pseudonocardia acaciae]|uniref:type III PLP-dependent enzyme n=1 Tax=Pseudonocardia acaciae TaxID=551276 RepID=UPI001FE19A3A|nr:type III PLP-dependent enzyme [Pseudonocardia acaciae]
MTADALAETALTGAPAAVSPPGPTPCLVMDLAVVRARYAELRAALPGARVYYAVKANPRAEVLGALADAGCGFDVASPGEIEGALAAGGRAERLCYANPVRTPADVAAAAGHGVSLFVTDSGEDLEVLADGAPGASVLVRLAVDDTGSATPFGGKFGCSPARAVSLLLQAASSGLDPAGLSFHVGSQQSRPAAWADAIAVAASVAADAGLAVRILDVGGGFPVPYRTPVPPVAEFGAAIEAAVRRHFPGRRAPELAVEPGRLLVAEAGVLHASAVRVSVRDDGRRWVYLDVGRYGGLAETEGEAIGYRLATDHDGPGVELAPAVLAGPTCDGDDVLYREVALPAALRSGDAVRLLAAGAYTASYASVGFNGLPPLAVRCVDSVGPGS